MKGKNLPTIKAGTHSEPKRPSIPAPTGPRPTPPQFDGVEQETEERKSKQRVIQDLMAKPKGAADALELSGTDALGTKRKSLR